MMHFLREMLRSLVDYFGDQAIDFFSAVRSQLYDEQITQFIQSVGIENVAKNVVNARKMPTFARPNFQLPHLIEAGETLVREQDRVRTMGLVGEYNQAVTPVRSQNQQPPQRDHKVSGMTAPDKDHHSQSAAHANAQKSNSFERGSFES